MITEIIYKNVTGEIISRQQALAMGNYKVHTIVSGYYKSIIHHEYEDHIRIYANGVLIKKDYTQEKRSQWIQYFLNVNEVKSDVINELFNNNDIRALYIYNNIQESNGFISYDWEYYKVKDTILSKGIKVFDSQLNEIMNCKLDINTNDIILPVLKEFNQYYEGRERHYSFEYVKDLDETLGYRIEVRETDNFPDDFYLEYLLEDLPNFFIDFPYYEFVLPLVPAPPIV